MEISATRTVIARKNHRCYWCGETIPKGTPYPRWACFDNGTAVAVRCHNECYHAWCSLRYPDNEEVRAYEYSRGCTCERGRCACRSDTDGLLVECHERIGNGHSTRYVEVYIQPQAYPPQTSEPRDSH